jgi:hypothetical protein
MNKINIEFYDDDKNDYYRITSIVKNENDEEYALKYKFNKEEYPKEKHLFLLLEESLIQWKNKGYDISYSNIDFHCKIYKRPSENTLNIIKYNNDAKSKPINKEEKDFQHKEIKMTFDDFMELVKNNQI